MSNNFLKQKRRKFFFDKVLECQLKLERKIRRKIERKKSKIERKIERKKERKKRNKKLRKIRRKEERPRYLYNKSRRSALNPKVKDLLYSSRRVRYKICIRVKQNNIFCTFRNIKKNKTLLVASSGKLKIKITKKTFKFLNKRLIKKFLNKIFNFSKKRALFILVDLIAPIRSRRFIVKYFSFLFRRKISLFFCFKPVKCFNGCKPKKKKRKKQKSSRLFK